MQLFKVALQIIIMSVLYVRFYENGCEDGGKNEMHLDYLMKLH